MRGSLPLLLAVLIAGPAAATSGISDRFDGIYAGQATPPPDRAMAQCPSFSVGQMHIAKGIVSTGSGNRATRTSNTDEPVISGFITEEGFLSGTITLPQGERDTIEGRLEDGILVAGI